MKSEEFRGPAQIFEANFAWLGKPRALKQAPCSSKHLPSAPQAGGSPPSSLPTMGDELQFSGILYKPGHEKVPKRRGEGSLIFKKDGVFWKEARAPHTRAPGRSPLRRAPPRAARAAPGRARHQRSALVATRHPARSSRRAGRGEELRQHGGGQAGRPVLVAHRGRRAAAQVLRGGRRLCEVHGLGAGAAVPPRLQSRCSGRGRGTRRLRTRIG